MEERRWLIPRVPGGQEHLKWGSQGRYRCFHSGMYWFWHSSTSYSQLTPWYPGTHCQEQSKKNKKCWTIVGCISWEQMKSGKLLWPFLPNPTSSCTLLCITTLLTICRQLTAQWHFYPITSSQKSHLKRKARTGIFWGISQMMLQAKAIRPFCVQVFSSLKHSFLCMWWGPVAYRNGTCGW